MLEYLHGGVNQLELQVNGSGVLVEKVGRSERQLVLVDDFGQCQRLCGFCRIDCLLSFL